MSNRKKFAELKLPRRLNLAAVTAVVAGVALAGVCIVLSGRAAVPGIAFEAEDGAVVSPAAKTTDSAASGGQAVKFGGALPGDPTLTRTVLVNGLNNPWDLGFLPDGTMFFTERTGALKVRLGDGTIRLLSQIPDVIVAGEGGLLGLAVDPQYATNRYIYTCFSSNAGGTNDNRLVRWTVSSDLASVGGRADIVTGLPYSTGRHSGCRPRFAPDGYLWLGTGDAAVGTNPQSKTSLGGKVLRVDRTGAAAPGNAGNGFDARIYNYGHRNVQGIMFRPGTGQPFDVEHGTNRDDELNRLIAGANYGYDPIPGYNESVEMTDLVKFPDAIPATWTSGNPTIAPSGGTFLSGGQWRDWDGAAAIAVLKDQHLMIARLNTAGTALTGSQKVLQLGVRLRIAVQGPDGNLYIATDVGSGGGQIWKVVPN